MNNMSKIKKHTKYKQTTSYPSSAYDTLCTSYPQAKTNLNKQYNKKIKDTYVCYHRDL